MSPCARAAPPAPCHALPPCAQGAEGSARYLELELTCLLQLVKVRAHSTAPSMGDVEAVSLPPRPAAAAQHSGSALALGPQIMRRLLLTCSCCSQHARMPCC